MSRMTPYIVRQGDFLQKLAFIKGFDAEEVWNDPRNEELRKLRPNPSLLAPGDILYIPPQQKSKVYPLQKGAKNSYLASVPMTEIELTLKDGKEPIANEPCEVQGVSGAPATTDGDGKLKLKIPCIQRDFTITLTGKDISFHVGVGHLDPLCERNGVVGRLCNLGYLPSDMSDFTEDEVPEIIAIAIASFQADQGQGPTGELDDATRKAIGDAHGL